MAETYILLAFSAQPVESVESEGRHGSYYGTFLCSEDQPDALQFLDDILSKQSLRRNQTGEIVLISKTEDLDHNGGLKAEVEERGYGLSLIPMHFPK